MCYFLYNSFSTATFKTWTSFLHFYVPVNNTVRVFMKHIYLFGRLFSVPSCTVRLVIYIFFISKLQHSYLWYTGSYSDWSHWLHYWPMPWQDYELKMVSTLRWNPHIWITLLVHKGDWCGISISKEYYHRDIKALSSDRQLVKRDLMPVGLLLL